MWTITVIFIWFYVQNVFIIFDWYLCYFFVWKDMHQVHTLYIYFFILCNTLIFFMCKMYLSFLIDMFMLFFCMKRYASSTHTLYLDYFLIFFVHFCFVALSVIRLFFGFICNWFVFSLICYLFIVNLCEL